MRKLVRAMFVLALISSGVMGAATWAKKPGGGGGGGGTGCPRDIQCADIYDPVICADGIVYGNACYAYRDCAPGPCTSTGGGSQI
jgi:hypothetical protein